ncbi:MAG: phage head closure protein [Niameybacter sp.]
MKNEIIEIETSKSSVTKDGIGDMTVTPKYKEVFAEKRSVKQSEFYQAHAQGLKPEIVFVIHPSEYEEQKGVRYKNKQYRVIRTYEKDYENLELVVTGDFNGRT